MFARRDVVVVLGALVAGFLGGQVHFDARAVSAASAGTIRADRIEILGESGKVLAYLGSDHGRNPSIHFLDGAGADAITLGLRGDSPFLDLFGRDSKVRATLRLENADRRPVLAMSDAGLEGRLMLGFLQPDVPSPSWDRWGLLLRAPRGGNIADLTMMRDPTMGSISGWLSVRGEDGRTWSNTRGWTRPRPWRRLRCVWASRPVRIQPRGEDDSAELEPPDQGA